MQIQLAGRFDSVLIILLLLNLYQGGIPHTSGLAGEDISLTMTTDKGVYSPGDTAFFLFSGGNSTGYLSLRYKSLEFGQFFFNITGNFGSLSWKIPIFASNGTYTAVAFYNNLPGKNSTLNFGVYEDNLALDVYRFLELNLTIWHDGRLQRDFEVIITNLYTDESLKFDDGSDAFLMTLDDDPADLIKYKIGQAIKIEVITLDNRFSGDMIIAAHHGMNHVQVGLHRLPNERLVLGYLFAGLFLSAIIYVVRRLKNKQRYVNVIEYDPFDIDNL